MFDLSSRSRLLLPAVTLAFLAFATGCSNGDGPTPAPGPGGTGAQAPADVPVGTPSPALKGAEIDPPEVFDGVGTYGGTLTWAVPGEIDNFHPFTPNGGASAQELRQLLFNSLVAFDNAEWENVPSLAHSWEHSEDFLTWTFELRKGVKWSDGEDFDSTDVVWTFNALFHPKAETSVRDLFRIGDAPYPDISAVDAHTVQFKLHAVDAMFLSHVGSVSIAPEHVWAHTVTDTDTTFESEMTPGSELSTIVGTGPYRIVEYSAAERAVYERNPYYWKVDSRGNQLPYADRVIVLIVKNIDTMEQQFLASGFDLLTTIQPSSYKRFSEAQAEGGDFQIHRLGVSLNTNWMCLNQHPGVDDQGKPYVEPHKRAWFEDVRFRRAVSHALDREGMCRLLMDRRAEPIYHPTTQSNKVWYTSDLPQFEYDVDAANALLDELGLEMGEDDVRADGEGRPVEFVLNTNTENPLRVKIIDMIKEDLAKVGVRVITRQIAFNDLVTNLQDGHKWEAIVLGWGSGIPPDPLMGKNIHKSDGRLHCWFPQQPEPATEWEARVDELFEQMDAQPIAEERVPLWHEVLRLQGENQPMTYLFASKTYACSRNRVKNVRPSLLRPTVWWNLDELYLENGGK